jgi:hypothetical protein
MGAQIIQKIKPIHYTGDKTEIAYMQCLISISNFRRVLYVVCFLLGNSPPPEFYMPTFWNTYSVQSS